MLDFSHNDLEGAIPQDLRNWHAFMNAGLTPSSSNATTGFQLTQVVELNLMGNPLMYAYILETDTHINLSSNALMGAIQCSGKANG